MLKQTHDYDELLENLTADNILSECRIAVLTSDKKKTSNNGIVYADCRIVKEDFAWICPYDFLITVYEPNVKSMSEEQMKILFEHELMHCGVTYTPSGDIKCYIRPHDVQDFRVILEEHGVDWAIKNG